MHCTLLFVSVNSVGHLQLSYIGCGRLKMADMSCARGRSSGSGGLGARQWVPISGEDVMPMTGPLNATDSSFIIQFLVLCPLQCPAPQSLGIIQSSSLSDSAFHLTRDVRRVCATDCLTDWMGFILNRFVDSYLPTSTLQTAVILPSLQDWSSNII